MNKMIFVNLPVADMERSKAFYEAIGATNEPKFSSPQGAMMKFSDQIAVMLLTPDFYRGFTSKPIADAHGSSQVLLAISCDDRAGVDRMVEAAAANGGGLGQMRRESVPGLLGLRVQALEGEQVPVAQQRPEDLVVVDAQVIDAGLGHLQGLAGEACDADPWHVEADDLSGDRLDRG